jgi:transcriptional regulator with XRE-family HTH domain
VRLLGAVGDGAVLEELGRRIARRRIDRSWTQAHLAGRAGIGKRTLERIEAGRSTQLVSFVRVLRALDLLDNMDPLIPEAGMRPMDYLKRQGRPRRRASVPRVKEGRAAEWKWGDEQ